ncbi:MAG TPA: hypothetical protein VG652_02160 [Gaiellaceae bacterium]|nr:hypothetical protein [Gaiellaceae bacterium]
MRSRVLILGSVVPLAVLSLLAAGCGGGGGSAPGIASVASSTTATTTPAQNGLLAFSACMRSNGMPNFPDPQHFVGGNVKLTLHQLGTGNPKFQAAISACNHLLPSNGGGSSDTAQEQRTKIADGLSFARCMRSHGVARFPDPSAQGDLTVEMVQAQGIDVHSPAVLHAIQTCLPASHGALTPAKVREALSNAGG